LGKKHASKIRGSSQLYCLRDGDQSQTENTILFQVEINVKQDVKLLSFGRKFDSG